MIEVPVGAEDIIVDGVSVELDVVLAFEDVTEGTLLFIFLAAGGSTLGSSRLRFLDQLFSSYEGVLDAEDIALVVGR